MSSSEGALSRRAALAGLAALPAAACGFAPVYGPGGRGRALDNAVEIEPPPNDAGAFDLAQQLQDRLGPPLSPPTG